MVDRIISMVDEVRSGHYLDIDVSAFHDEKAAGHEHIMRKLRELE